MNKNVAPTAWVVKHRVIIVFVIIFLVSLTMRLYNFNNRIIWNEDVARDILVGRHIALNGEYPTLGPSVGYVSRDIYYPPYYFYLVGAITKGFTNSLTVIKIFVIIESLEPLIIFCIALRLGNFISATVASLLTAMSARMVEAANLWSPFVAMPFFYFGLLLVVLSKHKGYFYRYFGQALILFSAAIHLSYFVPSIVTLFMGAFEIKSARGKILYIFIELLFLILLFMPVILQQRTMFIEAFYPNNLISFRNSFLLNYFYIIRSILLSLFQFNRFYLLISICATAVVILMAPTIVASTVKRLWWVVLILFLTPFIASLFIIVPDEYVYFSLTPLIYVLLSQLSFSNAETTGKNVFRILLISVVLVSSINNFSESLSTQGNYRREMEKMTDRIVLDSKARGVFKDFKVYVNTPSDYSWGSPLVWYVLETKYNMRNLQVVNYYVNLKEVVSEHASIYLICRNYVDPSIDCQKTFERYNPTYKKSMLIEQNVNDSIYLYYSKLI